MIVIESVEYERKSTLRNLLELYKHDFSEYDPEDVNENGLYEYMYLDHYWTEEGRHPFFIRVDGKLAGFALIREIGTDELGRTVYEMAEFFVMKKYRQQKVGQYAAAELFNRFRGSWKVGQLEGNKPAQAFWMKTVGHYTKDTYQVIREDGWEGPILTFSTEPR